MYYNNMDDSEKVRIIPLYLLDEGCVGYFHIDSPIKSFFCAHPPGIKVIRTGYENGETYKFGSSDFYYIYELYDKDGTSHRWKLHYEKNNTELRYLYICQNKEDCYKRPSYTSW
jgi:hypothetical protein